jgi:hypothetical protein
MALISKSDNSIRPAIAPLDILTPTLIQTLSLLTQTSAHILIRTSILTAHVLTHSLYISRLLAIYTLQISHLLASYGLSTCAIVLRKSLIASKRGIRNLWKRSEKFRDKCFFEFMVWILNPNALALLIFWPGWILLGLGWVIWCLLV